MDSFGAAGLVILLVAAGWFIETYLGIFWFIVFLLVSFFVVRFAVKEIQAENARLKAQNAHRAQEAAQEAAQQLAYQSQILSACNQSLIEFENIPKDLMTAEELLSTAENEFQDGAFSPFWDSIERAMCKLGAVDGSIKLIAHYSQEYKTFTESFAGVPPPFPVDPVSAHRLGTVNGTAGRLKQIVRKAQRNFQFATIYEQRRTNEILIAGFTSLGEAIHGVGERLQESVEALGDQINDLSSSINDLSSSMTENNEKLIEVAQGIPSAIKGADTNMQAMVADQAARQEKANRMLDNIQRHYVPDIFAQY
ncbi:hypothetical protein [Methyloceanibacter sp.]|uniref:hypothetical protein n=1 Tax=Methyloceanibacter sp. TaxID=1965321 RepID=UPI003D6D73D0